MYGQSIQSVRDVDKIACDGTLRDDSRPTRLDSCVDHAVVLHLF